MLWRTSLTMQCTLNCTPSAIYHTNTPQSYMINSPYHMSEHNSQCYRYTWNFTTGVFGAVMQCELLLTQTSHKMDKQHNTIKNNRNTTPNNITPHHAKKHCTLALTVKKKINQTNLTAVQPLTVTSMWWRWSLYGRRTKILAVMCHRLWLTHRLSAKPVNCHNNKTYVLIITSFDNFCIVLKWILCSLLWYK